MCKVGETIFFLLYGKGWKQVQGYSVVYCSRCAILDDKERAW